MVGSGTALLLRASWFSSALVFGSTAWGTQTHVQRWFGNGRQSCLSNQRCERLCSLLSRGYPHASQLWLAFDGKKDQTVYVQIGVPKTRPLEELPPSVAVSGSGLPQVSVAFPSPSGLTGRIIATDDCDCTYHLPRGVYGHSSWISRRIAFAFRRWSIPTLGYVPSGDPGKFWVAVGEREEFGRADWAKFGEWTIGAKDSTSGPSS